MHTVCWEALNAHVGAIHTMLSLTSHTAFVRIQTLTPAGDILQVCARRKHQRHTGKPTCTLTSLSPSHPAFARYTAPLAARRCVVRWRCGRARSEGGLAGAHVGLAVADGGLGQEVGELLQWRLLVPCGCPQLGGQEPVGRLEGIKGCLHSNSAKWLSAPCSFNP